jgi:SAM-dependent methyltransferase
VVRTEEAFQQYDSSTMVRRLADAHHIDMIVLDEIHSVKQRAAEASKRRQILGGLLTLAMERNPNLAVLGMSATPVVNNLVEAVSLLEMVLGLHFAELNTRATIPNVIAIHEKLVVHGVRYRPKYQQQLDVQCIEIDGADLIAELRSVGKGEVLGIERLLLEAKLESIAEVTCPGTLIYTHYVEGIVPRLRSVIEDQGFRVAEFTGSNKSGLELFKRGMADVLIGSSTLGTGIDGLQQVCDRLVIATLPWTHAGYEQLIGRVYRQGSIFTHVDVFIPQVILHHGDGIWSWDVQRRDRILYKRSLADAAVDGVIPDGVLESEQTMLGRSLEALHAWIDRLESGESLRVIKRERLTIPLPDDARRSALRRFGDFATMNARFINAHSAKTHARLTADPSEWFLYHTLYREARKSWPEVPFDIMAEWLKSRPHLIVGDFGCGEALLAASIPNLVYSFDHVAVNDSVIACDMAHTGVDAGILDVAIFSLSLMGNNIEDYLREAHRLLKLDGRIKIAEPLGHWDGAKRGHLTEMVTAAGFAIIGEVQVRGALLYLDAMKA